MDITLNHEEISEAITDYVGNQGINLDGKETEVDFTAGRGGNGYSATISIKEPTPEKPKKVARTKAKAKPVMVAKASADLSAKGADVLNKLGLAELAPDAPADTEKTTADAEAPFDTDPPAEEPVTETSTEEQEEKAEPTSQSSLFGPAP